jgi:hypothetical protein
VSEIPPPNDPNSVPPPQYAAYPRAPGGGTAYPPGSADKLKSLADGYFGLNNVFIVNLALALGARGIQTTARSSEAALGLIGVTILALGIVVGLMSYPYNKKIAFGMDWSPGNAVLASILMALNSALCCGIIGYVVMQSIAMGRMKTFGVTGGTFGAKKKDVYAQVDAIRAQETQASRMPPSGNPA